MKNAITCRLLAPLAVLLAGGAALSAQDARIGVNVSLVQPMGDTTELGSMGFGVGAFWEQPLASRFSVRGTGSYNIYGGYENKNLWGTWEYKLNQIGLEADALFYFNKDRSFYALAGAGYYINSMDLTLDGVTMDSDSAGSGVGIGVGAGWHFHENFGVEAKYVLTGDTPHALVSVVYRF